ncbi:uncharacterized protein LOC110664718 [Hevea brasiliensis]|uniref:uncharacterized protein LOC110664718 n=1 Tax=Hevea brasiliensis TaxID=3981 RepID=UPI0025FCE103|nr:uncharacterized protein LOC110664718 [Hevea brasiliensis]
MNWSLLCKKVFVMSGALCKIFSLYGPNFSLDFKGKLVGTTIMQNYMCLSLNVISLFIVNLMSLPQWMPKLTSKQLFIDVDVDNWIGIIVMKVIFIYQLSSPHTFRNC